MAKSRRGKDWRTKMQDAIWPRMGIRRYLTYLQKRVLRLTASPHSIAAGLASGAAVSVFPLIGLHFFLGFVLAFVARGNMLAAAIGTAWGNPITFPLFFALSFQFGTGIRNRLFPAEPSARLQAADAEALSGGLFSLDLGSILPLFQTMMLGALPLSVFTWVFFYLITRALVAGFQSARRMRLARRQARAQASSQ